MSSKQLRSDNIALLSSLRHEEEDLTTKLEQAENYQIQSSQRLQILLPGGLFSTLEKLKKECSSLPGFYGLLMDLLIIPQKFQTCADIIGKIKVFSIIVDNFDTAKKILEANSRIGGERINIYPLE